MSKSYLIILIIFIYLFRIELDANKNQLNPFYQRQRGVLKEHYQQIRSITNSQRGSLGLVHAMVTGDKSKLSKTEKQKFKEFGLMHILTPSGLHLASLTWIQRFAPFLIFIITLTITTVFFFNLVGFYPIKRILIFKYSKVIFPKVNGKYLFALTFIIDVLINQYNSSPMSSLLSFLFWGTILTHHQLLDIGLFKKLGLNLLIVNFLMNTSTNLLSILFNPIISSLISLIFPAVALSYFVAPLSTLPLQGILAIFEIIFRPIFHPISQYFLTQTNIFLILLSICFFLEKRKLVLLILIFYSADLNLKMDLKVGSGKWLRAPRIHWSP